MRWFYLSDAQEQVLVEEEELLALIRSGTVVSRTMVWREGMPGWMACGEVMPERFSASPRPLMPALGAPPRAAHPQSPPPASVQFQNAEVRELGAPVADNAGWMKFLGALMILAGALMIGGAISLLLHFWQFLKLIGGPMTMAACIGAALFVLIGALYGGLGILLFRGATAAQSAAATGGKAEMIASLNHIGSFFKIAGIATLLAMLLQGAEFFVTSWTERQRDVAQDKATAARLSVAVNSYYAEYSRYPVANPPRSGDVEPFLADEEFMAVLTGNDDQLNPKRIRFFEPLAPESPTGQSSGRLLDAFGKPFWLLLDTDEDGQIEHPGPGGGTLKSKVGVFSSGPDRRIETWSDNVTTWE